MTSGWVDDLLLAGPGDELCLWLGRPIQRDELRLEVVRTQEELRRLGVGSEHSVAMRLPASVAHVATMLATWRLGAQLVTVDHRVTRAGFDDVLGRFGSLVVVTPERVSVRPGWLPRTDHVLVQVSSGSTGAPKPVGRRFADLIVEVEKTAQVPGMPGRGENSVVLAAFAHTYGLFAGLLHGLHSHAVVMVPEHLTARGILGAVRSGATPTTVFGVPFHVRMLASIAEPEPVPNLARMVSSGELIDPALCDQFSACFGAPLGQLYGMTETGMIAADLDGRCRPAVGRLASGVQARVHDGELLVRMDSTPYVGRPDLAQWWDGWFHTGDAASIDPLGVVTLFGRRDSQITVGGLKVDLGAVERMISAMDEVMESIVVNDGVIKAYVVLCEEISTELVVDELRRSLAPHQRPRVVHVLSALPKTPSGKPVRDIERLNAAVRKESEVSPT